MQPRAILFSLTQKLTLEKSEFPVMDASANIW